MAYSVDKTAFEQAGWTIKREDITLQEKIGKGEFGDVRLGTYRGQKVAVKELIKDTSIATQKFLTEAKVMTSLQHENLVRLLGLVIEEAKNGSKSKIFLVTEFMGKGSLLEYLRSRGRQYVTKKDQIGFAVDTCCGMAYLENNKIVHRDLAARNVLLSDDLQAKVADFGLASSDGATVESGKLPIKWTAPEVRYQISDLRYWTLVVSTVQLSSCPVDNRDFKTFLFPTCKICVFRPQEFYVPIIL